MIFKYTLLVIVLISCGRVYTSSADTTTSQLIEKLLESFSRSEPRSSPRRWLITEETDSPHIRVKPIPAPPPSPALGSFEEPVAWPYPPAPQSQGKSEFPLLESFLKSNGIQSNFQTNQISNNQWSERTPDQKPTPTEAPIHWGSQSSSVATPAPQYMEWGVPQKTQSKPSSEALTQNTQYTEWGVPQKTQSAPSSGAPISNVQYTEWGVPQKTQPTTGALSLEPQYREWGSPQKSQIVKSSVGTVPPPLNPSENFHIQHTGPSNQAKHFVNTLTMKEPERSGRDKLNVSFIMPPDIRPLSLNFDTGEVQIDFGDKEGRRVPIPAAALGSDARQYRSQLSLDQIFGTQLSKNAKIVENRPIDNQKDEDEEYIVVRHDMNKYAYDLPKGMSVGNNAQSLGLTGTQAQPQVQQLLFKSNTPSVGTAPTQPKTETQTVERYDVSGQKNLHFVLGRVSG